MNSRYLTIVVISFLATATSYAITPLEATDAILSRNADRLLAELERNAKNEETRSIANAPDPEIEGNYQVAPAGVDNRWGLGISYGLDWFGSYGARRELGGAFRDANDAEAEATVYAKRLEILDEIITYIYADRRLQMMHKIETSADSIMTLADRASQGGQISRIDLSKIAIEQCRLQSTIAGIEAEKRTSEGKLKTLNGGYSCINLLNSIDKSWELIPLSPLNDYIANIQRNPELLKAISNFNVAKKNISLTKTENLPGFSIGYSHDYEDGMHFNGASVGISIPVFSSRHKMKAAEAAKAVAEYQITLVNDKLEAQVASIYNEIEALDKAIARQEKIFNSTDYTTLLLKAFKGGEMSLTEYLTDLSWFYEAHSEYMELQYIRQQKASQLSLLAK